MAATNDNLVSASWADRSTNQTLSLPSREHFLSRFFIVKRKEGSFGMVSPFLINKCLNASVGHVKSVKKLRSGDLLVEALNTAQAEKLLKINMFGGMAITVTPHGYLNTSRGVISEADLLHTSEEEILEHLRDQLVSAVRRITIRRDGNILPTKHLILTFDTPKLPSFVIAGYLHCPIRPYVQNPLRCFQCQRFGHSKASCRGGAVCSRCAQPNHSSDTCSLAPKCVNCKGDHTSYSRSCPKWIVEKEIQTLKAHKNISYMEARKQVESRTPRVGVSYASVAASQKIMCTASTQTDPNQFSNNLQKTKSNRTPTVITSDSQNGMNDKPKPKRNNKNKTGTQTTNPGNSSKSANDQISNLQNLPQSKRPKKQSEPIPSKLTRKDFLKNRPITSETHELETDESLKVYVSPEENMLTDSSSDSDAVASNSVS